MKGKLLKIIREDSEGVKVIVGRCLDESSNFLFIQTRAGVEVYPIVKIVRIEILSDFQSADKYKGENEDAEKHSLSSKEKK